MLYDPKFPKQPEIQVEACSMIQVDGSQGVTKSGVRSGKKTKTKQAKKKQTKVEPSKVQHASKMHQVKKPKRQSKNKPANARPPKKVGDEHHEQCQVCGKGGKLVCCDGCTLVFHLKCAGLNSQPKELWYCEGCTEGVDDEQGDEESGEEETGEEDGDEDEDEDGDEEEGHQKAAAVLPKKQGSTSSKYRGVSWAKTDRKWYARIGYCGKKHHLGSFESELEAAKAYDNAALQFHGREAKLNLGMQQGGPRGKEHALMPTTTSSTSGTKRKAASAGAGRAKAAIKSSDDQHDDQCRRCGLGGKLICCDGCTLVFHLKCLATKLRPAWRDQPGGNNWYCPLCIGDRKGGGSSHMPHSAKRANTEGGGGGGDSDSGSSAPAVTSRVEVNGVNHGMRASRNYSSGVGRKGYCGFAACSLSAKQGNLPIECTVCTNRKLNARGFCCEQHWAEHHEAL
jgi:hypothetical protein